MQHLPIQKFGAVSKRTLEEGSKTEGWRLVTLQPFLFVIQVFFQQ
jgi:hypothetical protein